MNPEPMPKSVAQFSKNIQAAVESILETFKGDSGNIWQFVVMPTAANAYAEAFTLIQKKGMSEALDTLDFVLGPMIKGGINSRCLGHTKHTTAKEKEVLLTATNSLLAEMLWFKAETGAEPPIVTLEKAEKQAMDTQIFELLNKPPM